MRPFITAVVVAALSPAAFAQQPLPSGGDSLPPNHPPIAKPSAAPVQPSLKSEQELLQELDAAPNLAAQEKSFQVASSLGKLYYSNGRFADAVVFLRQAEQKSEPLRTLYVEQRKKAASRKLALPTPEGAGCAPDPKAQLEAQLENVRALSKAGQTAKAVTCGRGAVEPVVELHRLLAGALLLTGDKAGALASAEKAVETAPEDPQSLYTRGALLLEARGDDVAQLKRAKADFDKYLQLRPQSAEAAWVKQLSDRAEKAIAAGGTTKLFGTSPAPVAAAPAPADDGAVGPLNQAVVEAYQKTERTPELMQRLAKLVDEAEDHLAHGRFQEALANYRQVMPMDPQNGRVQAGLAWTLVSVNRQPMADRVWGVAVSQNPQAVDQLGAALKSKGDEKGAKALWSKLAASDPSYAARSGLTARIGQ